MSNKYESKYDDSAHTSSNATPQSDSNVDSTITSTTNTTTLTTTANPRIARTNLDIVIEKVVQLDALVATIFEFVNIQTLAIAQSVSLVWRDTGKMNMLWYPFLKRRWGTLLPFNDVPAKTQPKQFYHQCLRSEQKVMVEHSIYEESRTILDSKDTPLCMQFDGDVLMVSN